MSEETTITTSAPIPSAPAARASTSAQAETPWRKFAIALALLVVADWLMFDRALGLSVVIFLVALAAGSLVAAPVLANPRALAVAGAVLLAALVPVLLEPTPLSVVLAVLSTAHFALVAGGFARPRLADRCAGVAAILGQAFWRLPIDALVGIKTPKDRGRPRRSAAVLLTWVVPLTLGLTFLLLFRSANPMIADWIGDLRLRQLLRELGPGRVLFWAAVLCFVWPFVAVKMRTWAFKARPDVTVDAGSEPVARSLMPWEHHLLGRSAVLRSLVLFNLMFAVQTVLDLAYLWGAAALPEGMSLAAYAHRGAYPLIATALLAAAFVLVAMRPGGPAEDSRAVRALVFVWVGQNVLLVVSAILRLDLYIAIYTLTYLRVAAFVWMLLVAMGLVLIVVRIALGRSNRWLVRANVIALVLTLWFCGFVNIPRVIADYNVDHSRELGGEGAPLDVEYLAYMLGPQALPALDRYWDRVPADAQDDRANTRAWLVRDFSREWADWRSWNYRDWQLASYLAGSTLAAFASEPFAPVTPATGTPASERPDSEPLEAYDP